MHDPEESSLASLPCPHCGEVHPATFSHCPRTGRPTSAGAALIGRVIAGRYRVIAQLGEGGMGAVYVAEHLSAGRKVALKRLHPELRDDENAVRRFQREARAAAATGHEHIVEVLDLGFGEDGAPFLVMEYLRGTSLRDLLREQRQLAPRRACRITGQVLTALEAVHARGIVHRDLKPDNVLLTRRAGDADFVKVVDFGISKMRSDDEGGPPLTRTGVTLGTPHYMSPEQARGMKDLDHRVDLYAAGVMLYQCLTGRLPFEGDNYHQLLGAILSGKRPKAAELVPGLAPALGAILERAMATDRDARFASAAEMREALMAHGAGDPASDAWETPPAGGFEGAKTAPLQPAGSRRRRATPSGPAPGATIARGLTRDPIDAPRPSPDRPAIREALAPYAATGAPATAPTGEPTRVKGSLVSAAIEALSPGELDRVLSRLDPDRAARLRGVVLPMSWLPLTAYLELLRASERELGEAVLVRIGEATADRELTATHRAWMQSATPSAAVDRIPLLFSGYHRPGRAVVDRPPDRTRARVETDGLCPDTLVHARVLSAFFRRLLERAGAQAVRASVVSSRERGDEATATLLRWR